MVAPTPPAIRYGLVSALCLIANNIIIILADRLHQPLLVGVALAFILVGALGFRLHCRFTFPAEPSWRRFARYLGAMGTGTLMSGALLWTFSALFAWPMVVTAPMASVLMILYNFLASRQAIQGAPGGRCPC